MLTKITEERGAELGCELFSRRAREYAKERGRISVLDAGCGRRFMLDLDGVDYHLTGIDNSESALRIRRETRGDLDDWMCADLRDAPLPPGKYDLIYISFVLEHVRGAEEALDRLATSLKPGGLLLLRTPDRQTVYGFITRITPHRVHVWYKRWVCHNRNAGKAGHGPWPTVYDPIVSYAGITGFCRSHGLTIEDEYCEDTYSQFFGRFRQPAAAALRLIAMASFGRLTSGYNNLGFVIRKPDATARA